MNPFKKNNQILPIASLNSVYIDEILASDLFRPAILAKEIDNNRSILQISSDIDGEELFHEFNKALMSEVISVKKYATDIAEEFGLRLSKLLVTLKKPSPLSKSNRPDWTTEHWDYWRDVKKITFVGGLTSPILTRIFRKVILEQFRSNEIYDTNVTFIDGSSNLGTIGLSKQFKYGEALLFDFGQTNIKRAHIIKEEDDIVLESFLTNIKSDYLFYKFNSIADLQKIADKLDEYIIDVILKTMNEVQFKGSKIIMSIANYVNDGAIYIKRGGYGKLALLNDNYEQYLSQTLSSMYGKEIEVNLYHDTTAMAFAFDQNKKRAVISLGTAFGVAFID